MPQKHELEFEHLHKGNQTLRHTPAIFTAAGKGFNYAAKDTILRWISHAGSCFVRILRSNDHW